MSLQTGIASLKVRILMVRRFSYMLTKKGKESCTRTLKINSVACVYFAPNLLALFLWLRNLQYTVFLPLYILLNIPIFFLGSFVYLSTYFFLCISLFLFLFMFLLLLLSLLVFFMFLFFSFSYSLLLPSFTSYLSHSLLHTSFLLLFSFPPSHFLIRPHPLPFFSLFITISGLFFSFTFIQESP